MTFLILLFVFVVIVLTADLYCGGFRRHLGGDHLSGGRRPVRGENCGDCRTDDCCGGSGGGGARTTSFKGIHRKVGHLRVGPEYVGDVLALAPGQCSTVLLFILEPTIGGLIILIILVILFGPGRLFSVGRRLLVLVEAGRLDQLVVLLKEVVDGLPRARLAQLQPRAAKVIHVDHLLLLLAVFALLPQLLLPLSPLLLASPLAARAGVGVGVIGKGQRAQLVHLLLFVLAAALVAASQLFFLLLFAVLIIIVASIIIEVIIIVVITFLIKEGANLIANKAIVSWTSFGGSLSTTSTSSGRRCGLLLLLIMRISFTSLLFQALLCFFLLANEIFRANVTVAELPLLPRGQLLRLQALKLLAQADVLEVEAFDE